MQVDRLAANRASKAVAQLHSLWAKRIRTDSKKLGMPTSAENLAALAPDLEPEVVSANLTAIGHGQEYKDIVPLDIFRSGSYLFSGKYLTEARARRAVLRTLIVQKIREDTETLSAPITLGALIALSPVLGRDELREAVDEILKDGASADIRQILAFGETYLFSETYLSAARATLLAEEEQLTLEIVRQIRGDSKYLTKLTKVETLNTLAPGIAPSRIEAGLVQIMNDEGFADIKKLTARDGTVYAFSVQSMTDQYAQLLLLGEENDPCYAIAEMVRQESRVYPKPTAIEIFKYGLFNMDRNRLDEYVAQTQETYDDIKLLRFSSGEVYLYSATYMNEDQAAMVAKRRSDG
jgi:hypothetical protein